MQEINTEELNKGVKAWALKNLADVRAALAAGNATLTIKLITKDGVISRIAYTMPRSTVFVHKGAGRGHGGSKGSSWKNSQGNTVRTNPASFGKMNSGSRTARRWFDDTTERNMDDLREIVARNSVNFIINNLTIK